MSVVELSPDTCMAFEVLGCSPLPPFEYLGKKLSTWKAFLVLRDELLFFFFPNVFNIGTLDASFNKSGHEKTDNKI